MSILINKNTKVICQGFTGKVATFHSRQDIIYGTKLVCGVTPGKGGINHLGLPVYNSMKEAIKKISVQVSVIYVPPKFCKDSILEAIDSNIKIIICITEGIPVLDMLQIKEKLNLMNVCMIGPNCPGIISPGESKIGIMPSNIYQKGFVGIVSRSGTLTYEVVRQINNVGLGQSTCVGIGGDMILGSDFVDILKLFEKDKNTKIIVIVGEIGGNLEEKAALYIKKFITKPIVAYIAGIFSPREKRMGHAGAIISSLSGGEVEKKIFLLERVGVKIVRYLYDIGKVVKSFF